MIKPILSFIGLFFVTVALIISVTHYGEEVIDTYEKCGICLREGVESVCDCEKVEVYGGASKLFWIVWAIGVVLSVGGFLYRK